MPRPRNVGAPRHRTSALIIDEIEKRIRRNRIDAEQVAEQFFLIQPGGSNPGTTDLIPDDGVPGDPSDDFDDLDVPEPVAPASEIGTSGKKARADHKHEGVHAVHVSGQPLLTGDIVVQAGDGVEIVQTGQAIEIAAAGTGEGSLIHVEQLNTADINTAPLTGQQFTLLHPPQAPVGVYIQGLRMTLGVDYTISGSVVTFSRYVMDLTPLVNVDITTARITFDYWYRTVNRSLKVVYNTRAVVAKDLQLSWNVLHN
jgi:hypothetical protein